MYNILIIIILIIIILIFRNINNFTNYINYDDYHIVCARYNKDITFLNNIPIKNTIIQKYKDVPNIANEATSYLYYIINNYENLPKNIIFIHDENESWHHDGKITENIYNWINEYINYGKNYYEFNNKEFDKYYKNNGHPDAYNRIKGFKKFWDDNLKNEIGEYKDAKPECGKCCAQFIISKQQILKRSKIFYNNIYIWLINNSSGEGNGSGYDEYSGFMLGRYVEWTWRFIFNN